jgi:hypothetical protein
MWLVLICGLDEGNPDSLIVNNKADQSIKYLIIYTVDKFLMLDLPPGSATKLLVSPSRGDVSGVSVKGEFYDGRDFKNGAVCKIRKELYKTFNYHINITGNSLTIECPQLGK